MWASAEKHGNDGASRDHYKNGRTDAKRVLSNKLSEGEVKHILAITNEEDYAYLPPCKMVTMLTRKGIYAASESSFYRILKRHT